jgi:alpha-L-fucosidase
MSDFTKPKLKTVIGLKLSLAILLGWAGGRANAQSVAAPKLGGFTLRTHDFNTGLPDSFTSDGSSATIVAGGADIWNGADHFVFNYLAVTNDFDFRLRVRSVADPDGGGFARCGLMARNALEAGSRHLMAAVNAGNTSQTIYRTRAGHDTFDNDLLAPASGSNSWVRLTRKRNVFASYRSDNGTNWTRLHQFDGAREGDLAFTNHMMYLGIATSSHHASQTTTAVVSDFGVTPPAARLGPAAAVVGEVSNAAAGFVEVVTGTPVFYRWQANGINLVVVTNATCAVGATTGYSVEWREVDASKPLTLSVASGGRRPIRYTAKNLPAGLKLDAKTGLITGRLAQPGEFNFTVLAKNSSGQAETRIKLRTGNTVALTPPLGWNSYDAFGDSVTEAETLANARYLKKYLLAHGWNYVVIDFRWYDSEITYDDKRLTKERMGAKLFADEFGRLLPAPNRFPSARSGNGFKPLADEIHAMGLKFGFHIMRGIPRQAVRARMPIEGSEFTADVAANTNSICVWCPDMFGVQSNAAGQAWYDAIFRLYASWGLDYIKVDDLSVPYAAGEIEMIRKAIEKCGRPMVFSTSPGPTEIRYADHIRTNANLWRISGDFWDEWPKLNHQFDLIAQWQGPGGPGRWPDADMIPFGHIGIRNYTNARERQTRFTSAEQRTLMSLWALAPSPLMLGMNLPDNNAATLALLTNDEVLAVNQDPLGQPARRVSASGEVPEIWTKQLAGGALAVGLFNRGNQSVKLSVAWRDLGFIAPPHVRDLWAQKDLGTPARFTGELAAHASELLLVNATEAAEPMAGGKFQPTWESLEQYKVPEWFRDAKFGIWAHWGPQCEPEAGDWYARGMYQEGSGPYKSHLARYGHPATNGFKDVIREWQAERWNPEQLMALYKRAGAQYFFALANHHDNFDNYDSKYQPWNSVNLGPKQDLLGGWAKAARANGMRFGVSVHAAHAWSWYEPAQDYDGNLTKSDGKGTWWEGYDPKDLYAQSHAPSRDFRNHGRIHSQWNWGNGASHPDQAYCETFYNRTVDLINKYQPDLVYFDDTALPLWPVSDAGLKIAAHYYNANAGWHGGKNEAVIFGKILTPEQRKCLVWDVERGAPNQTEDLPWQTCTCIGSWHYERAILTQHRYKSAKTVIQTLVDVVSKNGNLLLSIPVRSDGTIDSDEVAVVEGVAEWMAVNRECIFGTRPWKVCGEGPALNAAPPLSAQGFNEGKGKPFTAADVRFTQSKDGQTLYAIVLGGPDGGVNLRSLGTAAKLLDHSIAKITVLGSREEIRWRQTADALEISPLREVSNRVAVVLKITAARR